jgi:hypothetical protein
MDQTQVEEIELSMQYILDSHPARENQVTENFEAMMSEAEVVNDAMLQANTTSNPF